MRVGERDRRAARLVLLGGDADPSERCWVLLCLHGAMGASELTALADSGPFTDKVVRGGARPPKSPIWAMRLGPATRKGVTIDAGNRIELV